MKQNIFVCEKSISDSGSRVGIIFEAGPTHEGLEEALQLIDVAVNAGADAVKFQTLDALRLVPSSETMFNYNVLLDKETGEIEEVSESLQAILLRRELSVDEWRIVGKYCREKDIYFFSTASNQEELELLNEIGVDCVKIASGDINYHHFLRLAAQYDWAVQIDTGSASLAEVEKAVDVLEDAGCNRIIINHCPSGYPARLDSINLRVVQTLKQLFPYKVAFSDHNPGMTMDIAAVALGVNFIEKTITLDKTRRSPEHIMSLEPHEASGFVQSIREVEQGLGDARKKKDLISSQNAIAARRSIVASEDLAAGTILLQQHIDYVRPGDGLSPDLDCLVLGKKIRHGIQAGEKITCDVVES